jgi:hypothetical protein
MELRGGILIIGSLYWETSGKPHRKEWRNGRLRVGSKFFVRAPIRYGRWSESRESYTMIFSQLCRENQELGKAIVIPCQYPISSVFDLINEARQLWRAEQPNRTPPDRDIGLSKDWGCVALLGNPKGQKIPKDWLSAWEKEISSQKQQRPYGGLMHAPGEEPIVDKAGMLKIDWPEPVASSDRKELDRLDLLLATANDPTLEGTKYPSAKTIADAWIKAPTKASTPVPKDRYFLENRKNGVETFQDQSILELLTAAGLR